jgi:diketogulonate reductase-like aldo/keto reductase
MKGSVLELNNGVDMPALGLGFYQSPPQETVAAVKAALMDGYSRRPPLSSCPHTKRET